MGLNHYQDLGPRRGLSGDQASVLNKDWLRPESPSPGSCLLLWKYKWVLDVAPRPDQVSRRLSVGILKAAEGTPPNTHIAPSLVD